MNFFQTFIVKKHISHRGIECLLKFICWHMTQMHDIWNYTIYFSVYTCISQFCSHYDSCNEYALDHHAKKATVRLFSHLFLYYQEHLRYLIHVHEFSQFDFDTKVHLLPQLLYQFCIHLQFCLQ